MSTACLLVSLIKVIIACYSNAIRRIKSTLAQGFDDVTQRCTCQSSLGLSLRAGDQSVCVCVCVSSASVELDSAGNTPQLSSLSNESLGWVIPSSSSNSSPESRIMSELRLRRMQPSIPPHMMSLVSAMMSLAANQTRAGIVRANQTPGGPAHRTFCPRWRSQLWNEVMQRKADKSSLRGESSQLLRGWDEVQRIRFYG